MCVIIFSHFGLSRLGGKARRVMSFFFNTAVMTKSTAIKQRIVFPMAAVFLGLFSVLLFLEILFRMLPTNEGLDVLPVNAQNPIMRFRENRDLTWSAGWDFRIVANKHSNNYGFLNNQDYSTIAKLPLLAIIGDSYVEAAQVQNQVALHGVLSREAAGRARVYSFGASGAALPTYLAYGRYVADTFKSSAMVFVIVGNDFHESSILYKSAPGYYYFTPGPQGGTRLLRKDYLPSFMVRTAKKSALLRYMALNLKLSERTFKGLFVPSRAKTKRFVGNTEAEAGAQRLRVSKRAVEDFLRLLPQMTGLNGDRILFVMDAMRPQIYDNKALDAARGSFFDIMRRYFMDAAKRQNHEVIDLQPVFIEDYKKNSLRFDFPSDLHWNAQGHRLAAEAIMSSRLFSSLMEKSPKPPSSSTPQP